METAWEQSVVTASSTQASSQRTIFKSLVREKRLVPRNDHVGHAEETAD